MRARVSVFQLFAIAWTAATVVTVWLRFEFHFQDVNWIAMGMICLVAAGAQLGGVLILSLHRRHCQVGSFDKVPTLSASVLLIGAIVGIPVLNFESDIGDQWSMPLITATLAFVDLVLTRYFRGFEIERASLTADRPAPVLVSGAGFVGSSLVV